MDKMKGINFVVCGFLFLSVMFLAGCGTTSKEIVGMKLDPFVVPVESLPDKIDRSVERGDLLGPDESSDKMKVSILAVFPTSGEAYWGTLESGGTSGEVIYGEKKVVKIQLYPPDPYGSTYRFGFRINLTNMSESGFWFENGYQACFYKLIKVEYLPGGITRYYFEGGFVVEVEMYGWPPVGQYKIWRL